MSVKIITALKVLLIFIFLVPDSVAHSANNNDSAGGDEDGNQIVLPLISNYQPPKFPETTNQLSEDSTNKILSISSDGSIIVFSELTSELENVDVGDIIIGGVSDAAPYGFLRKVISLGMNGDQLILNTEQAAIDEAYESISIYIKDTLLADNIQNFTSYPGVKLVQSPDGTSQGDFEFQLSNTVIYDGDDDLSTKDDQILANGSLLFAPDYEFRLKIDNFSVEEIYFTNTMRSQVGMTISSKISGKVVAETPISPEYPLGIIYIPGTFLVLTPVLRVYVGVNGELAAGITSSVTQDTTFTAGLHYSNDNWEHIADSLSEFEYDQPHFSQGVSFKGYAGPKITFLINGIAGPYVRPSFALKLEITPSSNPWLTLKGGIEVPIGVSVQIISHVLVDYSASVVDFWYLLFSISDTFNNPPNSPNNPSPENWAEDQPINITLSWTGGDPDGDNVTYDVYLESYDETPDVLVSNDQSSTNFDPGTLTHITPYYWQIVARDENGATTSGPVWFFSTQFLGNDFPHVPSNPSPSNGATNQSFNVLLSWSGGDPDGDNVTYDVHLGSDPIWIYLICDDTSQTYCDPNIYLYDTQYYWYVVAKDEHGATSISPTWSFRTEAAPVDVTLHDIRTSDYFHSPKSSFRPGETIYFLMDVYNHEYYLVNAVFDFDIYDPQGFWIDYLSKNDLLEELPMTAILTDGYKVGIAADSDIGSYSYYGTVTPIGSQPLVGQISFDVEGSPISMRLLESTSCTDIDEFNLPYNPHGIYTPDDEKVVIWSAWEGASGEHSVSWEWFRPDGTFYSDETNNFNTNDSLYYTWDWIYTSGMGNDFGVWSVEIYLDGTYIRTDYFTYAEEDN